MENKATVFDVIKNINVTKDTDRDTRESMLDLYDPFVVNKSFSLHLDTILYCNEMNIHNHIDKKMQYDYYMNAIRKRNRWAKWPKKSNENTEIIKCIMQEFNMNYKNALNIYKIMTSEELGEIIDKNKKDDDNE